MAIPGIAGCPGGLGGGGAAPTDPNFSSVVFLSDFDGSDGQTSATDDSNSAHAITFVGNAQIDTAQSKFGGASLLLDGTDDYVTAPDSADWDFGTGQFTIEGWFRFAATPTNAILLAQWSGGWAFWFDSGQLYFRSGAVVDTTKYTWSPATNTWYHIAIDRDASNVARIYVDGVMQAKTTGYTENLTGSANPLALGTLRPLFTTHDLNGWADEVRITKGVARYASDGGFTPPTAAFPRS